MHKTPVNESIVAAQMRVITDDGTQVGVLDRAQALSAAREAGLDLVQITDSVDPVVCKITNYGKFVFDKKKKRSEAKKHQTKVHLKEIKFRPSTKEGDYKIKMRHLAEFLTHGDIVKVSVNFRGREMMHKELGMELLKKIEKDIENIGKIDQAAKLEGRRLLMMITPLKRKQ